MSPRARLILFGVSAAGFAAVLVYGMRGLPHFGDYSGVYGTLINGIGVTARHATDLVTALNFDLRGFDTLGEEFILFASVLGVVLILRQVRGEEEHPHQEEAEEQFRLVEQTVRHPRPKDRYMLWRYAQHLYHSLGELWLAKGDAAQTLEFAEACLKLAEPTISRKNLVKGWRLKGQALLAQGQGEQAEPALARALTMAREIGNPPQLWKTYQALGALYEWQADLERARAAYQSALDVIDGVAARLQDQELQRTFLAARPVQAIRERLAQAGGGRH